MNRRRFLMTAASAGLATPLLAGCGALWPSYTFNYKLRLLVSVGGTIREGFSIVQVALYDRGNSRLPEMQRIVAQSWGEAVVLDLGTHGLLFGLLRHPPTIAGFDGGQPQRVLSKFVNPANTSAPDYELPLIPKLVGEFTLTPSVVPTLVRFGDINDPKSAKLVKLDSFAEVYGPGARFERAAISITEEPRTVGVLAKKLPWWSSLEGNLLGGRTVHATGPFAGQITRLNFELAGGPR